MTTLTFDERERDTILAALRFWQRCLGGSITNSADVLLIADGEHNDPLDIIEISELCERINCGDGK